jgi:hypothetical protein
MKRTSRLILGCAARLGSVGVRRKPTGAGWARMYRDILPNLPCTPRSSNTFMNTWAQFTAALIQ